MKKILKVSLGALFAALPMMAGASNMADAPTVADGNKKVATVSYVIGAYDATKTAVNSKQDQLKNATGSNISSTVSSAIRAATGENAADNETLVTELAVRTAVDSALASANNAISNLNSEVSQVEGTDAPAITITEQAGKLTSVTASIGAGTISSAALATSAVITDKINAKAVTTAKIDDKAVTSAQIADNTITAGQIATSAVEADEIATSAVINSKIADSAVTFGKIDSTAVASTISSTVAGASDSKLATEKAIASAIAGINSTLTDDFATKTGVQNLIKHADYNLTNSAVTGHIIAMSDWGDSATTTNIDLQSGFVTDTAVKAVDSTVSYSAANSNIAG